MNLVVPCQISSLLMILRDNKHTLQSNKPAKEIIQMIAISKRPGSVAKKKRKNIPDGWEIEKTRNNKS